MNKDKFTGYFTKLQSDIEYVESLWKLLNEGVCDALFRSTEHQMDAITTILEYEYPNIEDMSGWVGWFVYDANFGKKPLQAEIGEGVNSPYYLIASIGHFHQFMEELNEYYLKEIK